MLVLAAFMLGFFSSLHCVGMCGPIALAIPVKNSTFLSRLRSSLIYNAGRIITYTLLGIFLGMAGHGFALAGWQNILSVVVGTVMLVMLFMPGILKRRQRKTFWFIKMQKIKMFVNALFLKTSTASLFLIGMINGLLPCGLVYLALAASLVTGSVIKSALFMGFFGLGTWPAMVSVGLLGQYIGLKFRNRLRKTVPFFVGLMAVLFILRGLNLGIPYLSPATITHTNGSTVHACCHK